MNPRPIDCIVVHCSDSPDDRSSVDVREIRKWHTELPPKGNGWTDVGYHYVVRRDGEIEVGRMESAVGAHAPGYNKNSIGVVWVGKVEPSKEQRATLVKLVRELMQRYAVGPHRVFGHKELNPGRDCPVIDMVKFREEIAR